MAASAAYGNAATRLEVSVGVGPRVGQSAFGLIAGNPWTSPYEDITLKAR